jgi:hypothetical protein
MASTLNGGYTNTVKYRNAGCNRLTHLYRANCDFNVTSQRIENCRKKVLLKRINLRIVQSTRTIYEHSVDLHMDLVSADYMRSTNHFLEIFNI